MRCKVLCDSCFIQSLPLEHQTALSEGRDPKKKLWGEAQRDPDTRCALTRRINTCWEILEKLNQ